MKKPNIYISQSKHTPDNYFRDVFNALSVNNIVRVAPDGKYHDGNLLKCDAVVAISHEDGYTDADIDQCYCGKGVYTEVETAARNSIPYYIYDHSAREICMVQDYWIEESDSWKFRYGMIEWNDGKGVSIDKDIALSDHQDGYKEFRNTIEEVVSKEEKYITKDSPFRKKFLSRTK